jgi:hypothetical protein
VGLNSLKSLNLTNLYPNNNKKKNNNNIKVKSKPLELFEIAGKKLLSGSYSQTNNYKLLMSAVPRYCGSFLLLG